MRVTSRGVFTEYGDKEFVLLSIFDNKEYKIFHEANSISEMIKDLQKMSEKAKINKLLEIGAAILSIYDNGETIAKGTWETLRQAIAKAEGK